MQTNIHIENPFRAASDGFARVEALTTACAILLFAFACVTGILCGRMSASQNKKEAVSWNQLRPIVSQEAEHGPIRKANIGVTAETGILSGMEWGLAMAATGFIGWARWKSRQGKGISDTAFLFNHRRVSWTAEPAYARQNASSTTPSAPGKRFDTSNSANCHSCGKPAGGVPHEKISFGGGVYSMCPSCARQHHTEWLVS